jgi:hypothetical protein
MFIFLCFYVYFCKHVKMVRSGAQKRKAKKDLDDSAAKSMKLHDFFTTTPVNADVPNGDNGGDGTEATGE